MDGPGCFFYGYTERQGGFNGPGTDQGAMVIAGVSGLVYGNAGGRKRWRNVFMRSNAGYPISLWIPSSIYRFFFSATECIWFQHPSVLKGPWHQARLFPFVKYWNAQTSASGIRVCISGGGGDGWVRRGGMGDLGGLSWFAFASCVLTPSLRRNDDGVSCTVLRCWGLSTATTDESSVTIVHLAWSGIVVPWRRVGESGH